MRGTISETVRNQCDWYTPYPFVYGRLKAAEQASMEIMSPKSTQITDSALREKGANIAVMVQMDETDVSQLHNQDLLRTTADAVKNSINVQSGLYACSSKVASLISTNVQSDVHCSG